MSRAVIVVRTANRPEIFNRCIMAAVEGCDVAREAHWVVLDDSSPGNLVPTLEIAQFWKKSGLRLAYVDKNVEEQIADSLPGSTFRSFFTHLVAKPVTCPTTGGRNLALAAGLSLDPEVIFFVDDDMVHRHEGNCFFHWCANSLRPDSFIAAPRKLGISDMTYLNRLVAVLDRADWAQFVSDAGISSDPDSWYSPRNPFWKPAEDEHDGATNTLSEKDVVNGQLMALRNNGAEWLPFPSEYNEDLNWSLLQSFCFGTAILKVGGANAQHLPPCLGHPKAESILSELVGTAITRALRQIKPRGEQTMDILAVRLPEVLASELKQELFLFLDAERAILSRVRRCTDGVAAGGAVSKIESTLADVGVRLESIDSRQLAGKWLNDFITRSKMFAELRHNAMVQRQIRRVLLEATV
jgi:hypothetical protein